MLISNAHLKLDKLPCKEINKHQMSTKGMQCIATELKELIVQCTIC